MKSFNNSRFFVVYKFAIVLAIIFFSAAASKAISEKRTACEGCRTTSKATCSSSSKVYTQSVGRSSDFPKLKKDVDLFIWAGQSNAQGWAGDGQFYPQAEIALDDSIGLYYTFVHTSNSDGKWIKMQAQKGRYAKGHFGAEVSFARRLKRAGYNPVIFKFCIGATSIYKDWKRPGEGGIYDQMVLEYRKAVSLLKLDGYNVKVRGFIWIQGESDAENDEMANAYYGNLRAIVRDVRAGLSHNAALPVLLGVDEQHEWVQQRPIIVNSHRQVAIQEQNALFTSMYGLPKADGTHLTPEGLVEQGNRLYSDYNRLLQIIRIKKRAWVKLDDQNNTTYYSAGWNAVTDARYYGSTFVSSIRKGATSTFFFNGTRGRVFLATGKNCGKADVYVDNVYSSTIDTYSPAGSANLKIFETPQLPDGSHSIKLVVNNKKNRASSGTQIVIDGFSFFHNDIKIYNGKGTHINSPATRWQDALVGANGLHGVMDFCDPTNNKLVVNHAYLAEPDGGPQAVPDLSGVIEQCKDDNLAGNYLKAATRAYDEAVAKGCVGYNTQAHHPGYYIKINQTPNGIVSSYKASVNYETGEIIATWKDNNGKWERRTFVSYADNMIVTYLTKSDKNQEISCNIELDPYLPKVPSNMTFESIVSDGFMNLRAIYNHPKQNAGYEGVTRVVSRGGSQRILGTTYTIINASSVVLLTRLNRYKDDYRTWNNKSLQEQLKVLDADYETLLARHIAVYTPMYNRVNIDLNGTINDRMLSSEQLVAKEEKDSIRINNSLLERMFQSGLYLYISNSGFGSPRLSTINLGAWGAAWSGDWTTDANTNLQVSGGNMFRQTESLEAYFNLFEKQLNDWKVNARNLLGCRGIMAPVRTDGEDGLHTHFFNGWPINFWTSGADWLLLPFCEYYETTGDDSFLRNRLFPWLKELGHFYADFLNRTDANGKKIFAVSWSPENTPLGSNTQSSINATMDIAAARHTLSLLVKYSKQLGLAKDSIPVWSEILNTLPPYLIGSDGALKEWAWPTLANSYNHRHISHLYPVFGTQEINQFTTPELFEASKKALDFSGIEDGSAFGYCQRTLSEAKLYRAEKAYKYLKSLMKNHFVYPKSLMTSHYNTKQSDIYCSDMACGLPTMITNMICSSKPGWLELLPALPRELSQGSISGIKGTNRVLIDSLKWNYGARQIQCELISDIDQVITLHVPLGIEVITSSSLVTPSPLGNNLRNIWLKAGVKTSVSILFQNQTSAKLSSSFVYGNSYNSDIESKPRVEYFLPNKF